MTQRHHSLCKALLAGSMLAAAWPALAANVTPDRLVNADREPQNWLMNHRSYDGQRFSPLARINKGNVKGLKLAYAVPLGGSSMTTRLYPDDAKAVVGILVGDALNQPGKDLTIGWMRLCFHDVHCAGLVTERPLEGSAARPHR
jgi:glucose dehydrogenase